MIECQDCNVRLQIIWSYYVIIQRRKWKHREGNEHSIGLSLITSKDEKLTTWQSTCSQNGLDMFIKLNLLWSAQLTYSFHCLLAWKKGRAVRKGRVQHGEAWRDQRTQRWERGKEPRPDIALSLWASVHRAPGRGEHHQPGAPDPWHGGKGCPALCAV